MKDSHSTRPGDSGEGQEITLPLVFLSLLKTLDVRADRLVTGSDFLLLAMLSCYWCAAFSPEEGSRQFVRQQGTIDD
jgi:hypothetical protein